MGVEPGRSLIVGCGGIGGVLGATLLGAGVPVYIATTNSRVRDEWTSTGPRLNGRPVGRALPLDAVRGTPTDFEHEFSNIFIAVQPSEIELVTKQSEQVLSPDGRIVCLSNGLCEEHMGALVDPHLIVGAVVSWGARMKSPGHYTRTSEGGFRLGKLTSGDDPRLGEIETLLSNVGPVRRTDNLRGARFAKLTINCAVTALGTIGGQTLGQLLVRAKPRSLALSLMKECAQVAAACDVVMEPVTKVDLGKLASEQGAKRVARVAQHALLLLAGTKYRRLRSSMLAAIERGRAPSIDYINGEVVRLGQLHGVPTPFNRAATRVVWEIYRRELEPGKDALQRVSDLAKSEFREQVLA